METLRDARNSQQSQQLLNMFPARASELQACMWGLTIKNIPAVNRTEDVRSGSPARDCAGAWGSEMVQCALELRGWRRSDLAPRHLPTSNESEGHGLVTHSFIDSLHVEPPSLCPDEAQRLAGGYSAIIPLPLFLPPCQVMSLCWVSLLGTHTYSTYAEAPSGSSGI